MLLFEWILLLLFAAVVLTGEWLLHPLGANKAHPAAKTTPMR